MKRRDFLKCSLAVGAGLAASPSTYACLLYTSDAADD